MDERKEGYKIMPPQDNGPNTERGGKQNYRECETQDTKALAARLQRFLRVLIASGGTEPVLDGGGSGHSIFMRKLLDALANPST